MTLNHVVASAARLPTTRAYGIALDGLVKALKSRGDNVGVAAPTGPFGGRPHVDVDLGGLTWGLLRRLQINRVLGLAANEAIRVTAAYALRRSPILNGADLLWTREMEIALANSQNINFVVVELHHPVTFWQSGLLRLTSQVLGSRLTVVGISPSVTNSVSPLMSRGTQIVEEPSGVSKSFFMPWQPRHEEREIRLAYVGSFSSGGHSRGCQIFIDLVRELINQGIDCHLILAGGTTEEVQSLSAYRDSCSLGAERINVLGRQQHEEVAEILSRSDILLANYPESLAASHQSPLKLVEYSASGRPIVASATSSVTNTMPEGAFLPYREGNLTELTEAVVSVASYSELSSSMSSIAQRWAYSHTWEARTERIISSIGK